MFNQTKGEVLSYIQETLTQHRYGDMRQCISQISKTKPDIFFQQNFLRLKNSCKNYEGMTNIFYTAIDDMAKV